LRLFQLYFEILLIFHYISLDCCSWSSSCFCVSYNTQIPPCWKSDWKLLGGFAGCTDPCDLHGSSPHIPLSLEVYLSPNQRRTPSCVLILADGSAPQSLPPPFVIALTAISHPHASVTPRMIPIHSSSEARFQRYTAPFVYCLRRFRICLQETPRIMKAGRVKEIGFEQVTHYLESGSR